MAESAVAGRDRSGSEAADRGETSTLRAPWRALDLDGLADSRLTGGARRRQNDGKPRTGRNGRAGTILEIVGRRSAARARVGARRGARQRRQHGLPRAGYPAERLAALDADLVTIAMGFNDFAHGKPLATFRSDYGQLIDNLRSNELGRGDSTPAMVVAITPIRWLGEPATNAIGLTLEQYRGVIGEVIAERAADPSIHLVDGVPLVPADRQLYAGDGLHPNDAGFAAYATNLAAALAALGY
jgi:lysophospholipase L1-like esterase